MAETTFLLVRHGMVEAVGRRIAGRGEGAALTGEGRAQSEATAAMLAGAAVAAVYASPLRRTEETAAILARRWSLDVQPCDALLEIDFGEWTGRSFEELADDPAWRRFNVLRSAARVPSGESALEVQARAVDALERLRGRHPGATVVLVSHADVIRALLGWAAGTPLDLMLRFEVGPASVSILALGEGSVRILGVNLTPSGPWQGR